MPVTEANDEKTANLLHRPFNGITFEEYYDLNYEYVKNLAYRIFRNHENSEEAAQDAFLQLHEKFDTFRGNSKFDTWFYRLVINVCLIKFRSEKKHYNWLPIDETFDPRMDIENRNELREKISLYDQLSFDPSNSYVDTMYIRNIIDNLPRRQKEAIVLHNLLGYTHKEISKLLGISIGCSKSNWSVAYKKMMMFGVDSTYSGIPQKNNVNQESYEQLINRYMPKEKN